MKGPLGSAYRPVRDLPIQAKDFKTFDAAYSNATKSCNGCHQAMGYGFIQVTKLGIPADSGMSYTVKSEPGDVPP